jgi:hypothetical protein
MWPDYATGLAAVMTAWLAVQRAWRSRFADARDDPDALAGRLGCHGTCDLQTCARRCAEQRRADSEENDP